MPLILPLCLALLGGGEDWPRFRGAQGDGVSDGAALPVQFGPAQNLVWRADAPMGR
jgi:hypothetical protein